jgi:hypothetical protein
MSPAERRQDTVCWFCGKGPNDIKVRVGMFRTGFGIVKDRFPAGQANAIVLSPDKQSVYVPRCTRCRELHDYQPLIGMLGAVGAILITVAMATLVMGGFRFDLYTFRDVVLPINNWGPFVVARVLTTWVAMFIAALVGYMCARRILKIRPLVHAGEWPDVRKLKEEGWEIASIDDKLPGI